MNKASFPAEMDRIEFTQQDDEFSLLVPITVPRQVFVNSSVLSQAAATDEQAAESSALVMPMGVLQSWLQATAELQAQPKGVHFCSAFARDPRLLDFTLVRLIFLARRSSACAVAAELCLA
jgi:hypothetical protein